MIDQILKTEIDGIGPDGEPAKFRFAEGRLYEHECPDCGEANGGGIEREGEDAAVSSDPWNPVNCPCIWCGKGPMVIRYSSDMVT